MSDPVDLEVVRAAKAKKCPFCGEAKHDAEFGCPRIESVIFHSDSIDSETWDAIEVCLRDPETWDPDLAG